MKIFKRIILVENPILFFIVTAGAFIFLIPFAWTVLTSFKTPSEIHQVPPTILPNNFFNFWNYSEVFRRVTFLRFLVNSMFISITSTFTTLLLSSLAGYGFSKYNFPGKEIFFFGVISILIVPFQAMVIPLYLWISRFRLMDSYPGIMLPLLVSSFGVFLTREFVDTIPNDYIDAARIDGCSELKIFFHVILPNIKPALATLGVIKFMWTWNEFFWPLIVTNSNSKKVVTLGITLFSSSIFFPEYHVACAAAVLSLLPMVIIFVFAQKWVVKGISLSGLKG